MNWDSGLEDITLVSPLVSTRLSVGSNPRVSFREDTKTSGGNPEGPNPGHEHDFFLLVVFVLQGPFFQDSPRLRRPLSSQTKTRPTVHTFATTKVWDNCGRVFSL